MNKQEVLTTAKQLIAQNGATSTKEVKLEMRCNDVPDSFAYQQNISNIMSELAKEGELDFKYDNRNYRTYYLQHVSINPTKSVNTPTSLDGIVEETNGNDESWLIFNVLDKNQLVINEQYDRDIARRYGNKIWTDIHYNDIRACRVKNFKK